MNVELAALKTLALLHDPPIKPIVFALGDGGREKLRRRLGVKEREKLHEALARYLQEKLVDVLKREGKKELAEKIEEYLSKKHLVRKADTAASSVDRTLLNAVYGKQVVSAIYFKNPLSLKEVSLDDVYRKLAGDVNKVIKLLDAYAEALARAAASARDGYEYMMLWRSLIPAFVSSVKSVYGLDEKEAAALTLTPADTRAPTSTLFDHLYASSCIATAVEDEYIGLVYWEVEDKQKFISRARIPRDLWGGSYLISILTLYTLLRLAEELGPDAVVRPQLFGNPLFDIYVRCVCISPGSEGKLREVGAKPAYGVSLLKVLTPVVPGAALIVVPGSKAEVYAEKVLELYREAWRVVVECVKSELKKSIDSLRRALESDEVVRRYVSVASDDVIDRQSEELPLNVSVAYLRVPWKFEERRRALRLLAGQGLLDRGRLEAVERVVDIAERLAKGTPGDHLYDWPLLVEAVFSLHAAQSRSKVELTRELDVEKRSELCNVCWQREAVVALREPRGDEKEWREFAQAVEKVRRELSPLGVKEGDRLCLHCLVRRKLWDLRENGVLVNVLAKLLAPDDKLAQDKVVHVLNAALRSYRRDYYFAGLTGQEVRGDEGHVGLAYPSTLNLAAQPFVYTLLSLLLRLLENGDKRKFEELWARFSELLKAIRSSPVLRGLLHPLEALATAGCTPKTRYIRDLVRELLIKAQSLGCQAKVAELVGYLDYVDWLFEEQYIRLGAGAEDIRSSLEKLRGLLKTVEKALEVQRSESAASAMRLALRKSRRELPVVGSFVVGFNDYIALIKGDGDGVGDMLSMRGAYSRTLLDMLPRAAPILGRAESLALHSSGSRQGISVGDLERLPALPGLSYTYMVSRALSSIALLTAERASEELGAVVVFSGGDDILLLSSAIEALRVVRELRKIYFQELIEFYDELWGVRYLIPGLGHGATQSFSVRYVDAFSPLKWEIEKTVDGVEEVKEVKSYLGSKNGVCIAYGATGEKSFVQLYLGDELLDLIEELGVAAAAGAGTSVLVSRGGAVKVVKSFSSKALEVPGDLQEDYAYHEYLCRARRHGLEITGSILRLAPRSVVVETPLGVKSLLGETLRASLLLSKSLRGVTPVVVGDTL